METGRKLGYNFHTNWFRLILRLPHSFSLPMAWGLQTGVIRPSLNTNRIHSMIDALSIRALDDLWRENSESVNRLPLSKFEFCGESFHLMKTKLAVSVQMCGVRRLEQWIYSLFSKHVSFVRDGMDSYPCVAPFKRDRTIWPWCFNGLLKEEQMLITVPYSDQHESFGYFGHCALINKLVYYIYFSLFMYIFDYLFIFISYIFFIICYYSVSHLILYQLE